MALIIGQRLATLHDLETIYSFEDALNLAEVIIVRNFNEYQVSKDKSGN